DREPGPPAADGPVTARLAGRRRRRTCRGRALPDAAGQGCLRRILPPGRARPQPNRAHRNVDRLGAAPPRRQRVGRGASSRRLERRGGRPTSRRRPAGRGGGCGARPDRPAAGDVARRRRCRRAGRSRVGAPAGAAEGALGNERDHHHLDDELRRDQPHLLVGQGSRQGSRGRATADASDPARGAPARPFRLGRPPRVPRRDRRGDRRRGPLPHHRRRLQARHARAKPAGGGPRRDADRPPRRWRAPGERRPRRPRRCQRRPRRQGVVPGQLEPGLRLRRLRPRRPGPARRLLADSVRLAARPAGGRGRVDDAAARHPDLVRRPVGRTRPAVLRPRPGAGAARRPPCGRDPCGLANRDGTLLGAGHSTPLGYPGRDRGNAAV
ncbi:MAG: hypothetical protein AVDCRST_MAG59-293, partial [uncultured Thermomicrobiales bacterium]